MLDPFQRRHLIDALRPPPGYSLDRAIGTTYSLDLLALLTAPLAFTFFDYEADEAHGGPIPDPLALLEALRRYADRIAIFCDAGRIVVPRTVQRLYAYLEGSVFAVTAPQGGVFHPKLWLLRFSEPTGGVAYRLLCLSRNLTFDRSWDTALALDGMLLPNGEEAPANTPLAAFVGSLPGLLIGSPTPPSLQETIALMVAELPRVAFDLPAGFDALLFHPLGIPGLDTQPFSQPVERSLVISPFLTSSMLESLADRGRETVLISRLEELQVQPQAVLRRFAAVYTLNEAAEPETNDAPAEGERDLLPELTGLHAKLYVGDDGERAHVWTGSANATEAAFRQNVEFLAQLSGPRAYCGVDAVLGRERQVGLHTLLQPFDPAQAGVTLDATQERLDALVESWQRVVARLGLVAQVSPGQSPDQFTVALALPEPFARQLPPSVSIRCWPVTLGAGSAASVQLGAPVVATFAQLSYESLSAFFAFEIAAHDGQKTGLARFVLNLLLLNPPADRRQRLLRAMLQNRAEVLRFLLMLLADGGSELDGLLRAARQLSETTDGDASGQPFGLPLFEAMVRALDRDPARLEQIGRLVDDLRGAPETAQLLPDDFDAIWEPIRAAAAEVRQHG
jgi:hypothetical protein